MLDSWAVKRYTQQKVELPIPKEFTRRKQWHPTPVLLSGKSHGPRSLVGCSSWGCEESDTTEWLHFHFSLSCIGEGNGNPLQCSCLENPRDGRAWWAAVYGVAQGRTRLKRLSSSSSNQVYYSTILFLRESRIFLELSEIGNSKNKRGNRQVRARLWGH